MFFSFDSFATGTMQATFRCSGTRAALEDSDRVSALSTHCFHRWVKSGSSYQTSAAFRGRHSFLCSAGASVSRQSMIRVGRGAEWHQPSTRPQHCTATGNEDGATVRPAGCTPICRQLLELTANGTRIVAMGHPSSIRPSRPARPKKVAPSTGPGSPASDSE